MKEECERTRKALPDYIHGHVFRITRNRIERHLKQCAVCASEFDTLRRTEETRQFLHEVDRNEGIGHRVRDGIYSLAKLKKMLYRPLWLAGTALVVAAGYYYAVKPRQLDIEIDNIVKTAPVNSFIAVPPAQKQETGAATMPSVSAQSQPHQPAPKPAVAPLAVSIAPINPVSAVQRINEIMQGHGQLRKMKFTDTERVLAGTLTAQELLTFFGRIRESATVRYDRALFKSFSPGQQIPFLLTLKAAPKAAEKQLPAPFKSAETHTPAATKAPAQLQAPLKSAETHTPAATEAPAPPVTAPPPAQ